MRVAEDRARWRELERPEVDCSRLMMMMMMAQIILSNPTSEAVIEIYVLVAAQ
jgi:hypothetical protein